MAFLVDQKYKNYKKFESMIYVNLKLSIKKEEKIYI